MVAKTGTKVLLLSLFLTLVTKAAAQETSATNATKTENKSDSEKDKSAPKGTAKENVVLEPTSISGSFKPSFGPPNKPPKTEVTYYALKHKRHEPSSYYNPGPYHIRPRPYHHNNPYPHYRPHEGRYRGVDQGYRNHHYVPVPYYRKPWGSFPHYEVQHQQFGYRPPINYQHFGGYTDEFYERSRPRIYHSPLDVHTFQNYDLIKVYHSGSYEDHHDEKTSATASPKLSTGKPKEEAKDTILLIPETKDTKLEEEVTTSTTTTTTEETKPVTEEGKTAAR